MPRRPRQESASGIHHVMNRGVDHHAVFFSDIDRVDFGRQLAWAFDHLGVATLAYCLMSNHFHLLLRSPPGVLSDAMQHVISVYTRHTNDRLGRDGPLFRGRFHSIPVETDAYLLGAARYIHRNPLDLPGVDSPRDHRWSSYRAYLGLRRVPAFLDLAPVADLLGGGHDAIASFTEDGPGTAFGAPDDLRGLRRLIDCAIAVDDLAHDGEDLARQRLDRTLLTLLGDLSPDPRIRALVASGLDHRSPEAARCALRRARARHDAEPVVRRVLAWVQAELVGVGLTHSDQA